MPAKKKASSKAVTVNEAGTNLATIDDELKQQALALQSAISAPGGNKISIKATGDFVLPDGTNMGPDVDLVVVDFMARNVYYNTKYDPNDITPPACYAIDTKRNKAAMAPEDDSPEKQNDICATCPQNQFGSADNGRAKACQNRYWAAVRFAEDDEEPTAADPLYLLDLSPSNISTFEKFVNGVIHTLSGPPLKAVVNVTATNAGTYAKVTFGEFVPNPHYMIDAQRREEALQIVSRRPDFSVVDEAPAKKTAKRRARK